jgi:hypothetical protein
MTSSSLQYYEHFGNSIAKTQQYLLIGAPGFRMNGTTVGRLYGYLYSEKYLLQFEIDGIPEFQVGHCVQSIKWSGQDYLLLSAPHTVKALK